jgi:hypothetical protein
MPVRRMECFGCGTRQSSAALRRCGGCRLAVYCNEACQRRGWHEQGHAFSCAHYAMRASPRTLNAAMFLGADSDNEDDDDDDAMASPPPAKKAHTEPAPVVQDGDFMTLPIEMRVAITEHLPLSTLHAMLQVSKQTRADVENNVCKSLFRMLVRRLVAERGEQAAAYAAALASGDATKRVPFELVAMLETLTATKTRFRDSPELQPLVEFNRAQVAHWPDAQTDLEHFEKLVLEPRCDLLAFLLGHFVNHCINTKALRDSGLDGILEPPVLTIEARSFTLAITLRRTVNVENPAAWIATGIETCPAAVQKAYAHWRKHVCTANNGSTTVPWSRALARAILYDGDWDAAVTLRKVKARALGTIPLRQAVQPLAHDLLLILHYGQRHVQVCDDTGENSIACSRSGLFSFHLAFRDQQTAETTSLRIRELVVTSASSTTTLEPDAFYQRWRKDVDAERETHQKKFGPFSM